MRSAVLLLLAGVLTPPPAAAQTTLRFGAGVVQASKLLGDRVNPFDELYGIDMVQSLAPAIALSARVPFFQKYHFQLEAQLAATTLTVVNGDTFEETEFGKLKTLGITGVMIGDLFSKFEWQAGIGVLKYLPANKEGLFQDGGPMRWLLTGGISKRFPLNDKLAFSGTIRYDYHQFITATLKEHSFSQYQAVHRVGLTFGVERTF